MLLSEFIELLNRRGTYNQQNQSVDRPPTDVLSASNQRCKQYTVYIKATSKFDENYTCRTDTAGTIAVLSRVVPQCYGCVSLRPKELRSTVAKLLESNLCRKLGCHDSAANLIIESQWAYVLHT